ncbi:Chemotaxis response regulator protein-glutamate methylesterase of group 2 operon [Flagellimonas maritima]|uniref:Chemotaxis response regulator protein-glutamate methylesterase of group 2 operon n=1 Tax=Flagellimonas maritima TaxID=1383885 RepID=A0A2Z4LVT3_9FLAO|nr:LytTR family DNA-binding domain-containing protein [Allomuricauda aurantiaca]AWX45839.1 Chemotaxis response regulator protein-glutamate methylesterase of group 2 operon [Allomuricauda aurantiaca]
MSYQCVIIDDEPLARELLEGYLEKIPDFELVASCPSAIDASTILSKNKVDLLFLDIEMPVLKGTDFFKNLVHKPEVIFTTAYRDYAVDGFELNALDYLLKPIFFERFFQAIQKFLKQVEKTEVSNSNNTTSNASDYLFVNKAKKQIKVVFDTILYAESLKDYIKIHFQEEDPLTVKESISAFEKRLDNRFIRLHRSYIVNSEKITAYTKNDVEIGRMEIPIGNNYKDNLLPFLKSI